MKSMLSAVTLAGAIVVSALPCWSMTSAERRDDIAAFRSQFFERDRAYSQTAREQAAARLAALERSSGSITDAALELDLAAIAALADNGHTTAFAFTRSGHFNRAPIRLTPFGTRFYVVRAKDRALLGAELISIDGHGIETLRRAAHTLQGGLPSWRDRSASFLLESPEQLHAMGLARRAVRARYVFRRPGGALLRRTLTGEAPGPERLAAFPTRLLSPDPTGGEAAGDWVAALSLEQTPWALREPDELFRSRALPNLSAVLIQFRRNADSEQQTIDAAIARFLALIGEQRPTHIIVDMRWNGGGNLQLTRDFMKLIPHLARGRIFVLTSPWTFSAAISSVAYLKQEDPTRVTIVGEAVGDRLNFFSEGSLVTLPNSRAVLAFTTERHDYESGCTNFSDCHGPVRRFPIRVATLAPEIVAPWTIEAYLEGRDPGIEAIESVLLAP